MIDGIVIDGQTIDTIVMPNGEEISVGGVTPTGNIDITSAGTTDVTNYATATVATAYPYVGYDSEYLTVNNNRRWRVRGRIVVDSEDENPAGYIDDGIYYGTYSTFNAIASGTSVTPTESSQTIGGANTMMEGAVTVNAIPSNYVGTGITRRDSTDLTASGATVSVPSGFYENNASKAVQSGTEGTPTATKGTVTNHSVTVTPSVTNSAGYISGGTHSGTAVSVSASELVSGSQTLSDNGTYDVTNLAEIVVDVQGGGGGGTQVATKTATPSVASSSIQFTGLSGNPTSFVVTSQADIATNTNGVTAVVFDGSSLHGQTLTTQVEADTGFTKSYSNGTLTITATSAQFQANAYKLVYTYGGSASDIETADVQVGSGATSITFSVNGRPAYWSCIFKSDFSTSSGYQRVIAVANDGSSTYGLAMDSSANVQTSWTASYSGGNFTINSQSTNNGGYFHQPGYYQLTYYVDPSAPSYQSKTITPTTSQQIITADAGYDALSQVTVNAIPNTYVQPTSTVGATTYRPGTTAQTIASGTYHSAAATIAAVTQTNLTAANIKSGTTITISNGQSNLWSVTGTYEGDGGSGGTSAHVGTSTITNSSASNTSISFSSLSGTPIAFFVRCTSQLTRSSNSSYYYVTSVRHNGTNTTGNYWRMSNGTFYNDTSHYSYTYSNGTLTVHSSGSRSSAGGSFYNGGYELVYVYES